MSKSFAYDIPNIFLEEKYIEAKCCVHFRPDVNWDGKKYGFDWMRLGDTAKFGDKQPYIDIVTKQFNSTTGKVETDLNEYRGNFKQDLNNYKKLESQYQGGCVRGILIPWKKGKENIYYCSWLSLYPFVPGPEPVTSRNHKAELRLYLDIKEVPDRIEFSENEYLEISDKTITSGLKKGAYFWENGKTITIKCKEQFRDDQKIDVFAVKKNPHTGEDERKFAGRLMVWGNQHRQKKLKVLFVSVKTPAISGDDPQAGKLSGQQDLLDDFLSQALITTEVTKEELDVRDDKEFQKGGRYFSSHKGQNMIVAYDRSAAKINNVDEYLYEKMTDDQKKKYKDHKIVLFFGELGFRIGGQPHKERVELNGYRLGSRIVVFKDPTPDAVTHEILHSLGLAHTFTNSEADKNALFTYKALTTENIMDYSFQPRFALWYWQWKIINSNVKR